MVVETDSKEAGLEETRRKAAKRNDVLVSPRPVSCSAGTGLETTCVVSRRQDVAVDSWYQEFMDWATEPNQAQELNGGRELDQLRG